MSETPPTVRVLIHRVRQGYDPADEAALDLAARVEGVQAEIERVRALAGGGDGYHSGDKILRILAGGKP
jgi:hypothetical protein